MELVLSYLRFFTRLFLSICFRLPRANTHAPKIANSIVNIGSVDARSVIPPNTMTPNKYTNRTAGMVPSKIFCNVIFITCLSRKMSLAYGGIMPLHFARNNGKSMK